MTTLTAYAKPSKDISVHIRVNMPEQQDCIQLDAFCGQYEAWERQMIELAYNFKTPFWSSELRAMALYEPAHVSWWGNLYRGMIKSGKWQHTGEYRRNPRDSRRGGLEFKYMRCV